MKTSKRLIFGMLALVVLLCATGGYVAVAWPDDFDKMYEPCELNEAALILRMNYEVEGIPGSHEYAAYYRQRSGLIRLQRRLEQKVNEFRNVVCLEDYGDENFQIESGTFDGWTGSRSVYPLELSDGVHIYIHYTVRMDYEEFEAKEEVTIPFPVGQSGRQGRVSYAAHWERL